MRYFIKILFGLLLTATLSAQNGDTVYINASFCARQWCTNTVVSDVDFGPLMNAAQLQSDGCYSMDTTLWISNISLAPMKDDDPLNGVDLLDLVHIAQHILGITPLPSPYAMVAADINSSRSITTLDIIEARKLILGVYDTFPENRSWRFIDASYVFPNVLNPFQTIFPETGFLNQMNDSILGDFNFKAIKTGDVDCSAIPGLAPAPNDRSVVYLNLPDRQLQAGETVEVPVHFSELESWLGFQLGLQFDPARLVLENIVPGDLPGWDEYSTAQPRPGLLNLLWFDTNPLQIDPQKNMFTLRFRALEPMLLSEVLQLNTGAMRAEAFTGASAARNLQLRFLLPVSEAVRIGQLQPNPTTGSAKLSLELPEATAVQLDLWDVQGRLVWSHEWLGVSGFQEIELPETTFPRSGIYLWRVVAGAALHSGRLVRSE